MVFQSGPGHMASGWTMLTGAVELDGSTGSITFALDTIYQGECDKLQLGAYLILFPGSRMRLPLISERLPCLPRIPAGFVVLFCLILNLWAGICTIQTGEDFGVAYWGHIDGFFGAPFVLFFLRSEVFARYFSDAKLVR